MTVDKFIMTIVFVIYFFGWYGFIDQTFEVNPKYNFSNVPAAFLGEK